jgi:hypothetical protein
MFDLLRSSTWWPDDEKASEERSLLAGARRMNSLAIELSAISLLACTFVLGRYLRGPFADAPRRVLSAAAGVAVAYVFIRALPELSETQDVFTRVTLDRGLPFPERRVYTAALLGFLLFYGLENMVSQSAARGREQGEPAVGLTYKLQLGGFAAYCGLVGYLMVHQRSLPTLLYLIAMTLHFLAVNHSFEREYGYTYDHAGRWLLAAAVLVGGFTGIFTSMSEELLATLLGFNSGGVVINSMVMELPTEKEGRFWTFCLGAVGYSLLLLLI